AIVAPEHSAPTIATTCSELTRRSAPLTDIVASLHPVSAEGTSIFCPSSNPPCSFTWLAASLAASKIGGVRLSIGPVKPPRKPTLTSPSAADVAARLTVAAAAAIRQFLRNIFDNLPRCSEPYLGPPWPRTDRDCPHAPAK